ncbi:MATE family efflux transporter [Primorskyibacter sp. S187A]|uniref:MATE family efflux transporter n=1 Tax=Primorskyibacter sp. S187A TaxID=3415130 RepID=UPI003C7999F0
MHSQTSTHHLKDVMRIGMPLIGGHLGQFAIGLTDTIMMGRYSIEGLAALVLASSFFFVFFLVGSGFAWAVVPLVAAANDDAQTIRRVTRMALWLSALFGLLCLPLFWWSAPLLEAIGQAPQVAQDAQTYLRITGPAILPALGVMVLKSYLAALERTSVVFWITSLAVIVNALVNYALIFGMWGAPELGIAGAAWASVSVQLVSLLGVILYARLVLPEHDLFRRLWRPDFDVMGKVVRLGVPIGLTSLSEVSLFAASAVLMGWLGTIPLAAHGIALQCATATFMVHLGLSNAATIRAGQAFGRGDRTHLRLGARVAIAASIGIALVTVVLFVAFPEPLISLFLKPDEPNRAEVIAIGTVLLIMAALFQLADGAQVMALGLLRGMQDTTIPMFMAAFSYWPIGLGSALLFGFVLDFGAVGVWAGLVTGLSCAALMMMTRFWRRA